MRICFVVPELFAFNRFGGYGNFVRIVARELQKRNIEVCAVIWRDPGQRSLENVEGILTLSYPYNFLNGSALSHVLSYRKARELYRIADADVYHSVEASIDSYIATKEMPDKKHLIHFQDPYEPEDYVLMSKVDKSFNFTFTKKAVFQANKYIVKKACKRAELFTQAKYFVPRVKKLYSITKEIKFLPNPISIPDKCIAKDSEPTVCFLGRWDPQKRVEMFLNLAKEFPQVHFIALGRSHNKTYDLQVREKYKNVKNLSMPGFVTEETKSDILGRSWILVSTSIREGLPIAFLEALTQKTAILSSVNPDNLASSYGLHVTDDDFKIGLKKLINNRLWAAKGEEGYKYVCEVHDINKVINQYVETYKELCS